MSSVRLYKHTNVCICSNLCCTKKYNHITFYEMWSVDPNKTISYLHLLSISYVYLEENETNITTLRIGLTKLVRVDR